MQKYICSQRVYENDPVKLNYYVAKSLWSTQLCNSLGSCLLQIVLIKLNCMCNTEHCQWTAPCGGKTCLRGCNENDVDILSIFYTSRKLHKNMLRVQQVNRNPFVKHQQCLKNELPLIFIFYDFCLKISTLKNPAMALNCTNALNHHLSIFFLLSTLHHFAALSKWFILGNFFHLNGKRFSQMF